MHIRRFLADFAVGCSVVYRKHLGANITTVGLVTFLNKTIRLALLKPWSFAMPSEFKMTIVSMELI